MFEEEQRITVDILEEVVANDFGCKPSDVTIVNHSCSAGSNKGENFTCVVIAVQVQALVLGKLHDGLEYMAKLMPMNEYRASWLNESKGFIRECIVYGKLLPEMQKLRKKLGLEPLGFPKCFFAKPERNIIVMENLKKDGFAMLKMEELTMDQIISILTELARYHATTYHYVETYQNGGAKSFIGEFPDFAIEGWMNESTEEGRKESEMLFANIVPTCIAMLQTCGEKEERELLIPKLEKFEKHRQQTIVEAFRPKGKFNVLIHNDLWSNNMLFKSNEVKFVDLQFVKRSRPTIDLNYFFCSSTTSQFRKSHFQKLLTHYHNILTQELKQMGYTEDLYPLEQLVEDYNDCFCFGMVAGFFHAQIKLVPFDGSSGLDINDSTSDEANAEIMIKMRDFFLERAKEAPEFVKDVFALFNEAVERKAI